MSDDRAKLDLYMAHRRALVDYATPILGCRARAEDVVQDSYVRFTGREGEAGGGSEAVRQPVAYLYRIVRNLALDVLRRLAVEGATVPDKAIDEVPSAAPTPEREALYRDQLRHLGEALAELPDRTRAAFEMHRLGGHTLQAVAAHLGISVGLAHRLVRDALTHCAERLGDLDE